MYDWTVTTTLSSGPDGVTAIEHMDSNMKRRRSGVQASNLHTKMFNTDAKVAVKSALPVHAQTSAFDRKRMPFSDGSRMLIDQLHTTSHRLSSLMRAPRISIPHTVLQHLALRAPVFWHK